MKFRRLSWTVVIALLCCVVSACSNQPGEDEFNKGVEAQRQNQYEKARQLFETALEINPALAEANINLGYLYLLDKNFDAAWEQTSLGLEKLKQSQHTIIMGESWQDQAILAYNNLAKIVFEKALAAREAGQAEEERRYQEQTLSLLKEALALDPEHEITQKNLAYIQRWMNEQ